jgi:ribonuclease HI
MPIRIVTDGASSGNPGPGGWAALIIHEDGTLEELGGHEPNTTNNRMELRGAIEGLRRVPAGAPVQVVTDSTYLINGITRWIAAWRRRGWKKADGEPVSNRDLWQELDTLHGHVTWEHVRGHAGHPENERANTIAQAYAARRTPPPAAALPPGAGTPPAADLIARIAAARPAGQTYLSLLGRGGLMRHRTWPECQARVHGVPGARYKKCRSVDEEIATVRAWGLAPEDLLALPA